MSEIVIELLTDARSKNSVYREGNTYMPPLNTRVPASMLAFAKTQG